MAENDIDVDELLDEHKAETEGGRSQTEAAIETTDRPDLPEAVADAYDAIDDGNISSNLTLRDENLAALVRGLEQSGRLEGLGADAADVLGREDVAIDSRAAVLRLLVRIGLSEVDESVLEAGKAGRQQYLDRDAF